MSEIKDYVPMLIGTTEGRRTGDIVTSTDWNTRWNLQIQQGDNTAMQVYGMTKMLFGEPSEDDPEDAEVGIFTQLSEDATKMREDLDTHVANTDNPHNVVAEQVSANPISGVAGSELQAITEDLKSQLDTKISTVTADNTYETLEDAATHIVEVDFNEDTGEFKFYRKNGSVIGIDTALEKIAVNFRFDEANQTLYIQAIDGTEQAVPLSAFITEYEFVDTDGVTWSRNGGMISASINDAYLNSCLSAKNDAEIAKTAAETAANNAASSEANAKKSETNAKTSESNASASALSAGSAYTNADKSAKLAQSYANGTSGSRTGEATDNAKFYMEQARQAAESLENGFVPMGEITFAGLQALTNPVAGQMYTVTDSFTATSDFVNTAGAVYQDHMNVYRTANGKWSVLGSFNQTVNGYAKNVITLTGNDIKLGSFTTKNTFTEVNTVNKDTTLKVVAESALSNTDLLKSGLDSVRTDLQTKADVEDIDFKNGVGESLALDTKAGGIRVNKVEGKTVKSPNLLTDALSTITRSSVTCTKNGDGTYTLTGTNTSTTSSAFFEISAADVKAGKKYKLTGCPKNTTTNKDNQYRLKYTSDAGVDSADWGEGYIFTASKDEHITPTVRVPVGVTCNNLVFKPMLVEYNDNDPDIPFMAYGDVQSSGDAGNITINECGVNLIKYPYSTTPSTVYGITWTVNKDGSVTANGTNTKNNTNTFYFNNTSGYSLIRLTKGRKYILSDGVGYAQNINYNICVYFCDVDTRQELIASNVFNTTNAGHVTNGPLVIVPNFDVLIRIGFRVSKDATVNNVTFKPMLTEEVDDITYRPYTSDMVVIPLSEPLRSIGDIKDYIDKDGIHRRIGKFVGGTVGWVGDRAAAGTTQINLYSPADFDKTTSIAISDKFTHNQKAGTTYTLNEMFIGSAPTKAFCVFVSNTLNITDIAKAQSWIDDNEPTFYYPLAEEVIEPLTDAQRTALESLQAYDVKTYVETTDEIAKPTLDVDYSNTSIGSELLGKKDPTIPKNGVDFFAPTTGGTSDNSGLYIRSRGAGNTPTWQWGISKTEEITSDACTLVQAKAVYTFVEKYVANKVDTIKNFMLMPDSWVDNTESATSGLYKFVYNVSTTNYTDASTPIWDVTGANAAYLLLNATEVKEAGYIREAVFSATGIKLYATEKPTSGLNLRVKGI